MGTSYVYCNHSRKEYVSLSSLRNGGDRLNAVYYCAEALMYLLDPVHDQGYRGRWQRHPLSDAPQIQILSDGEMMTIDLDDAGYTDISRLLLVEMRKDRTGYLDLDRFKKGGENSPQWEKRGELPTDRDD